MINTSKERNIITIYNPKRGNNDKGMENKVDVSSLPAACDDIPVQNSNTDFVAELINMLQQFTPDNGPNISALISCNLGLLKYVAASEKKREYTEEHHMGNKLEPPITKEVILSSADRKREYNKRYYRQVIRPRRQKELKKDANTQTENVNTGLVSASKLNQEIHELQLKLETKNKRIKTLEEQVDSLTKLLENLCKTT
jgi:hypothetical protein